MEQMAEAKYVDQKHHQTESAERDGILFFDNFFITIRAGYISILHHT